MRALRPDDLQTFLLKRFVLVLITVVLGSTALIQMPGVLRLRGLAREMRAASLAAKKVPPLPPRERVAAWVRAVPDGDLSEPGEVFILLKKLAEDASCDLEDTGEKPPAGMQDNEKLGLVERNIRLKGTYQGLRRFFALLRQRERVFAVTSCSIMPAKWPQLQAELAIRRYVWRGPARIGLR